MYENLINESVKISHARKESSIGEELKSVEIFQTTKRIFIFVSLLTVWFLLTELFFEDLQENMKRLRNNNRNKFCVILLENKGCL